MNIRLSESSDWRLCAVVEVPDSTPDFFQLVRDDALQFRVQRASREPTGYQWYELWVDASNGERRLARTAWAVLTALQRIAHEGRLEGFRIVNGDEWLTIGHSYSDMDDDGSMMLRNVATG
jgi:hypothetical protein